MEVEVGELEGRETKEETDGNANNQRPHGEGVMLVIPRICCKMVGDLVFHSVLSLLAAKAKGETQWVT